MFYISLRALSQYWAITLSIFASVNMFYAFFCLKTTFLVYITGSLTLNLQLTAIYAPRQSLSNPQIFPVWHITACLCVGTLANNTAGCSGDIWNRKLTRKHVKNVTLNRPGEGHSFTFLRLKQDREPSHLTSCQKCTHWTSQLLYCSVYAHVPEWGYWFWCYK